LIPERQWDRAVEALQRSSEIAVCCHIAPDGDAYGSMLGLSHFLVRQGCRVWMSWGSPEITTTYQFKFLPGVDGIVTWDKIPEGIETFMSVDCADIRRLGLALPRFESAATTINLDHHISNASFGQINLVDPESASSSELTYELVKRMGGAIDAEEATCFYTGLVTDTGRFQFTNTSPRSLRTAAELLEAGADHNTIVARVYESVSFSQLPVMATMLSRAKLDDGLLYSWINQADVAHLGMEETEDFIDLLRGVREAGVTLLLKEQQDRCWKGSLRSRGPDVSAIAKALGGGGHAAAAGFSQCGTVEEIVAKVRGLLPG
jgi:bifunctional oligoribonuclease and PAP phosphatase NrnA